MSSQSASQEPFSLKAIFPMLLAIGLGVVVVLLDNTIMNIAMPKLVEQFHSDLKTMQWSITGYALALSAVIPLAGWFSDRFTAKRTFLTSLVLFMLGSLLCSFAHNSTQLIIFRIIQGLSGGMIAPIGMAMSFTAAPSEKRGAVMSIMGLPMLVAPILGPFLSGYFVEYVNWRWIFYINMPIGIIAFLMGLKFFKNKQKQQNIKLDKIGMVIAPIAFVSLVYGIHEGGTNGWGSTTTIISLVLGILTLAFFIRNELKTEQPLLELRAFQSSFFTRGIILGWSFQMILYGSLLLIPLYLQQVRGFSPTTAGLFMIPQALMSTLGLNIGGRLADKRGTRFVVLIALIAIISSLLALTIVDDNTTRAVLIAIVAAFGLGQGLGMMQINTYVIQAAPKQFVSRITPITSSTQQIMMSLSITIVTAFLSNQISKNGSLDPSRLSQAFSLTFYIPFGISLGAFLLCLFLKKPKSDKL